MVSAYALLFGGFLLLGGRAADILGRGACSSSASSSSPARRSSRRSRGTSRSLIGARAIQGLGAAIIAPAALSILMTTFSEGKERNKALGVWGAVGGFGAAAGVLLGGVLTDLLSWEWIFFLNIPVGIAALALAPVLLGESRDIQRARASTPSARCSSPAASRRLVFGITQANDWGWSSARTLGVFAAAVVMLVGFVLRETRATHPLMSFSIFRIKTVAGANITGFILGTALFSMFLMLTLYMQQVLGYSALKTGVAYIAVAGTSIVWAMVAAAARDPRRRQAGARHGDEPADDRPPVLHAGLGRRLVPRRPAARLPRDRDGHGVLVRLHLDRGARRRAGEGCGPRVRADQHVAADRRRARDRRPLLGGGRAHEQRARRPATRCRRR